MTLGGILRVHTEENEWLSVKDNEIWELDQYQNKNILAALRLSYNHLPSYLKHCFAYCSLFPKDYKINRAKLIQLWIAQGFIQSSSQGSRLQLEDIGNLYFKDLLSRSFFQDVCEDDYGNIKTCKMHDLIHDLATSVAGKECMTVQVNVEDNFSEEVRHLSLLDLEFNSWKPLFKAKKLRTFLLPCEIRINISGSTLNSLCSSLRLLRVLDLSHAGIQDLPSSVGELKHLRLLNLFHNCFKTLPNSITKLKKLQVLNLDFCVELEELPKDIGKMVSLRHLELGEYSNLSHMPSGLGQLSSLQTLSKFMVGEKKGKKGDEKIRGCTLRELHELNQLRGKLGICIYNNDLGNLRSSIDEAKEAKLKEKHNLGALTLEWDKKTTEGVDIMYRVVVVEVLEGLQPHSNLKKLCIFRYKGMKFPHWMMDKDSLSLFQNLVSIEIVSSDRVEHIPPFGQLPFLESLYLGYMDALKYIRGGDVFYGGGELDVVRGGGGGGGFPSLKRLSLVGMPNLEEWSREVSVAGDEGTSIATTITKAQKLLSFPRLSELYIGNLPMLTSIPLHPSLEKLTLLQCSEKLLMNLLHLEIIGCSNMDLAGENTQGPTNLRKLEFNNLPCLAILPKYWLGNLKSLQHLRIYDCPNLLSFPDEMKCLTALQSLYIWGCPELSKRCKKMIGEDWSKIAHVPTIWIDSELILDKKQYVKVHVVKFNLEGTIYH